MKISSFIFSFFLLSSIVSAQTPDTLYKDIFGYPSAVEKAYSMSVIVEQGTEQAIEEFYMSTGKRKASGKKVSGTYGFVKEGTWQTFYKSGKLQAETSYKGGFASGEQKEWYENGQLQHIWKWNKNDSKLTSYWDSLGNALVIKGKGTYINYHSNGTKYTEGEIKRGKQIGLWQAWHNNGQLLHEVTIQEGIRIGKESIWNNAGKLMYQATIKKNGLSFNKSFFLEDGTKKVYKNTVPYTAPENWIYLGSLEPIPTNIHEVKKQISYPSLARDAGIQGQILVRVLVGKSGEFVEFINLGAKLPILYDAVAAQLPQLDFTPAIQDGEFTKFWVNIPFRFKLMN